jgi:ElaB/YqjD/DUF883 family membrane-anchored ribosome-binding protein
MSHSIFDRASEPIVDSVREASRLATAVADVIEDGVGIAKRAAKQSGDVVEDFVNKSRQRIRRDPLASVAVTLAAGIAMGLLTGFAIRRR